MIIRRGAAVRRGAARFVIAAGPTRSISALPPGGRRPRTLGLAIGTTPPCNCTAVQTDGMDPNARGSGWVTAVRFPRRGDTGADFSPSLSFTLSAPVCTSDSIAVAHWARG